MLLWKVLKKGEPERWNGFHSWLQFSSPEGLLSELIDDFQVIPSDAEEIAFHPDGPLDLVMENARLKGSELLGNTPIIGFWELIPWSGSMIKFWVNPRTWRKRRACLEIFQGVPIR